MYFDCVEPTMAPYDKRQHELSKAPPASLTATIWAVGLAIQWADERVIRRN